MLTVGLIVTVAQPVWSVRTSTPPRAQAYGSAVTLTRASCTTAPLVLATWKRPTTAARLVRRAGVNLTLSMINRCGRTTVDAMTESSPLGVLTTGGVTGVV